MFLGSAGNKLDAELSGVSKKTTTATSKGFSYTHTRSRNEELQNFFESDYLFSSKKKVTEVRPALHRLFEWFSQAWRIVLA